MELISHSLMPVSILLDYAPCFSAKSVALVKKKKKIVERKIDISESRRNLRVRCAKILSNMFDQMCACATRVMFMTRIRLSY